MPHILRKWVEFSQTSSYWVESKAQYWYRDSEEDRLPCRRVPGKEKDLLALVRSSKAATQKHHLNRFKELTSAVVSHPLTAHPYHVNSSLHSRHSASAVQRCLVEEIQFIRDHRFRGSMGTWRFSVISKVGYPRLVKGCSYFFPFSTNPPPGFPPRKSICCQR